MEKGYVQIYTGNGKGKTTAALGLALRAWGAGKKIYIGQFIKDDTYSEIKALRKALPEVVVEQFGQRLGFIFPGMDNQAHKHAAEEGFQRALQQLKSGDYDLFILDEINVTLSLGLLPIDKILELIGQKPAKTELVLTGRGAPEALIQNADLVTEMCEIKHYFDQGVAARVGIEK